MENQTIEQLLDATISHAKCLGYFDKLNPKHSTFKYHKKQLVICKEILLDRINPSLGKKATENKRPQCAKYATCGSTDFYNCSDCGNYETPKEER